MYGKEGSASRLANLQGADHCPPAGPRRGHRVRAGRLAGLFLSLGARASVLRGQRCPGPGIRGSSEPFGRVVCRRWGDGRWSVRGGGGLGDPEQLDSGESGSPLEPRRQGLLMEVVMCDSTCRMKSELCWGVFCGKPVRDCGEGDTRCPPHAGLQGCGRRRRPCRGLSVLESPLAATEWMWLLPAPAARGTQVP